MQTNLALLTFVKYPQPGKVKTRLAAEIGNELAAQLYQHFVRIVFSKGERLKQATKFVAFTPADKEEKLSRLFPSDARWFAQIDSPDLGDRMYHAINHVLDQGYKRVITIGTDSPSLPIAYLIEASQTLVKHDVVLGPADDGGYYLIGVKKATKRLFEEIDWSTEKVLDQTLERANECRYSVHLLKRWYDIDTLSDLKKFSRATALPSDLTALLRSVLPSPPARSSRRS